MWLAERLVAVVFGISFAFPRFPLYIMVVGVVIVLHVCSHLGSFYLPTVFFIPSFQRLSLLLLLLSLCLSIF